MTSPPKAGTEVEIKLGLVRPDELPLLLAALPAPSHVLHQGNYYFDTAAGALNTARIMLRVREQRRPGEPAEGAIAAAKRRGASRYEADEIECEIPATTWQAIKDGRANLADLDNDAVVWVRAQLGGLDALAVLGILDNLRTVVLYEGFTLEVDRTEFHDGTVDVEVEVETDDIDGARRVVEALAARAGVALFDQTKGKHRRFRERLGR